MSDRYISNVETGELNKVGDKTKPEWCLFCYNEGEDITLIDFQAPMFLLDDNGRISDNMTDDVVGLIREVIGDKKYSGMKGQTIVIRTVDVVS